MKNLYPWVGNVVTVVMKITNKIQISDLPVIIALTLLTYSALLLIQNQERVADEMAEYAYYLIVIGIAWKVLFHLLTKQQQNAVNTQ